MKIEVGKFYKEFDGTRVEIIAIDERLAFPVIGLRDGQTEVARYLLHTVFLTEEWREPVKVEGWVNVYGGSLSGIYKSKLEAEDQRNKHATFLACVEVSGTEGVDSEQD